MSSEPKDPAAPADPAQPPARRGPGRLALALTVIVVWIAAVQVLEDRSEEPAPAPPPATTPVQVVEGPDGELTAPGIRIEPDVVDPAWQLRFEEDLSRLEELRWTELVEVNDQGRERSYQGKLTLVFGDGVSEAWPVVDGEVVARVRPSQMGALADSGVLVVHFKHHPPTERDYGWLERFAPPQVVQSAIEPTSATLTLRNPNTSGRTVRVRVGWRDDAGWIGGTPAASAMADLEMGPGETREVSLGYAASDRGELSQPIVRSVVDPQPAR